MNETGKEYGFEARDIRFAVGVLGVLLILTPLYPQLPSYRFAFAFRSLIFLTFALPAVRMGWSALFQRSRSLPFLLPAVLGLLLLIVGAFYSPVPYHAKEKIAVAVTLMLLFLTLTHFPFSRQQLKLLGGCLVLGAALEAGSALGQQWLGHEGLIRSLEQYSLYDEPMRAEMIRTLEANRALGDFGNPNQLAGYLVLSLWAAWLLYRQSSVRWLKAGLLSAALVSVFAVYRSYSRSGLLALLGSVFLFFIYPWLQNLDRRRIRRLAFVLVMGVVLGGCLIYFLPPGFFGGRLLTLSTVVARLHFYRGAVLIIQEHPLWGVGPEAFAGYYSAYLRPGDLEAQYAHNWVLEAALEGGVPGLLLFFWLTTAVFHFLYLTWRRFPELQAPVYAAARAAAVFLFLSLVDFHNQLIEMWVAPVFLLAWVSRGVIAGMAVRFPRRSSAPRPWLRLAGYGAGGALAAVWVLLIGCRYLNEDAREMGYGYALTGQMMAARDAYERAVLYDRSDAESWNSLGHAWGQLPAPTAQEQRLEAMRQAVRMEPRRARFHADFAEALFALGYIEPAIREMKQAQVLFPARPVYYEGLATLYERLGQSDAAEAERRKARQLEQEILQRTEEREE
jgi:O-antigen ligase